MRMFQHGVPVWNAVLVYAGLNPLKLGSVLNFLNGWWVFGCLCEGFQDFCLQVITQKLLALLRPFLCCVEVPRQSKHGVKIAATDVKSWLCWLQWEFCHSWQWAKALIQKFYPLLIILVYALGKLLLHCCHPDCVCLCKEDVSLFWCHTVPFTITALLGTKLGQRRKKTWTPAVLLLVSWVIPRNVDQALWPEQD